MIRIITVIYHLLKVLEFFTSETDILYHYVITLRLFNDFRYLEVLVSVTFEIDIKI